MDVFKVSVIIPVYNAEKFLRKAVESAVNLKEVGEVILVEDASPDNALKLCETLKKEYAKIKIYTHPGHKNMGAGASRNLGVAKSQFDFIAFLDADDWYLPHRFQKERELLQDNRVDGVYGATGYYFEETGTYGNKLTTIYAPSSNLLHHLVFEEGHFHLNAFTIRKEKFLFSGGFKNELRLHQDTHLILKLCANSNFKAGSVNKAVAIRRVHDQNRITSSNILSKLPFRKAVYKDFRTYKRRYPEIYKKMRADYLLLKYFKYYFIFKEKYIKK